MSDLIDRAEVMKLLDEQCWNGMFTYFRGEHHVNCFRELVKAIPSVENKEEWIPVSERLPEKKVKDYLACCEDGYVATIMYDNGRWLINGNNVIAWMPLPEPYKPEKPETCKGCLEPCIMYEPDMRACKKKVTERGE